MSSDEIKKIDTDTAAAAPEAAAEEVAPTTVPASEEEPSSEELKATGTVDSFNPNAWYNKHPKGLLPYSSGLVQVIMVSFVCFMCPGMFNALSGMGGAGLSDAHLANQANIALNCTFATIGFFSGTIINTFGVPRALAFGGSGYSIYIAAFLCYKHTQNTGFIIFSGAWLGICAACLWAATSTCTMSYPTESRKGTYTFIFWSIFNLGGVIGSLIPLGQNMHNMAGTVTDGTYVAFLVLTIVGFVLATMLLPVGKVRRSDGSKVIHQVNPTFVNEMKQLFKTMVDEPWILLLFPMFFASNWFYTYEQSDFNTTNFTVRTRALNSLLFWLMQMVGSALIGQILDFRPSKITRKKRGIVGWIFIFCCTHLIWGLGWLWDKDHLRTDVITDPIDFDQGHRYVGPMFLYMFYGFFDAIWQCYCYWLMGALTNSARKAAIYAGYYKGIQSAGAAIAWAIDSTAGPYRRMYASTWGICGFSMLVAIPIVLRRIKETTAIEDDLKDVDETLEQVLSTEKSRTDIA